MLGDNEVFFIRAQYKPLDVIGKHSDRHRRLTTEMTAKEKQTQLIKTYLKKTLKNIG